MSFGSYSLSVATFSDQNNAVLNRRYNWEKFCMEINLGENNEYRLSKHSPYRCVCEPIDDNVPNQLNRFHRVRCSSVASFRCRRSLLLTESSHRKCFLCVKNGRINPMKTLKILSESFFVPKNCFSFVFFSYSIRAMHNFCLNKCHWHLPLPFDSCQIWRFVRWQWIRWMHSMAFGDYAVRFGSCIEWVVDAHDANETIRICMRFQRRIFIQRNKQIWWEKMWPLRRCMWRNCRHEFDHSLSS